MRKPWYDSQRKCWWAELPPQPDGSRGLRKTFRGEGAREAAKDFLKQHTTTQEQELEQWGTSGYISPENKLDCLKALDAKAKCGCPSLWVAVECWAKHNPDKFMALPLADAAELYIAAKTASGKRQKYIVVLRQCLLNDLSRKLPVQCHELTFDTIMAWADEHDWKLATKKRQLGYVKLFCEWAVNKKHATSNPLAKMEKIHVDTPPPGVLTVAECKLLLTRCMAMDKPLLPFLALQMFGGLRRSEAERVVAQGLRGFIRSGALDLWALHTKTRKRRFVELDPDDLQGKKFSPLKEWLAFDTGEPIKGRELTERWHKLRYDGWERKAYKGRGRPYHQVVGGTLAVSAWPNDCLRHTASSMLCLAIGTARESAYCGHSETVAENSYRGRFEPHEVKEFWGLSPQAVLGIGR